MADDSNTALLSAIREEANRIEEDAMHSSKRHYEAHNIWNGRHLWIGIPAVVLSVLAGAGVLTEAWPYWARFASMIVAILTALLTFLKPSERAASHKAAGDQYLTLRNDVRLFRTVTMIAGKPTPELSQDLQMLADRRNELNSASAQTPLLAFPRSRKGIEDGEATYNVDKAA